MNTTTAIRVIEKLGWTRREAAEAYAEAFTRAGDDESPYGILRRVVRANRSTSRSERDICGTSAAAARRDMGM